MVTPRVDVAQSRTNDGPIVFGEGSIAVAGVITAGALIMNQTTSVVVGVIPPGPGLTPAPPGMMYAYRQIGLVADGDLVEVIVDGVSLGTRPIKKLSFTWHGWRIEWWVTV